MRRSGLSMAGESPPPPAPPPPTALQASSMARAQQTGGNAASNALPPGHAIGARMQAPQPNPGLARSPSAHAARGYAAHAPPALAPIVPIVPDDHLPIPVYQAPPGLSVSSSVSSLTSPVHTPSGRGPVSRTGAVAGKSVLYPPAPRSDAGSGGAISAAATVAAAAAKLESVHQSRLFSAHSGPSSGPSTRPTSPPLAAAPSSSSMPRSPPPPTYGAAQAGEWQAEFPDPQQGIAQRQYVEQAQTASAPLSPRSGGLLSAPSASAEPAAVMQMAGAQGPSSVADSAASWQAAGGFAQGGAPKTVLPMHA